MIACQKFTRFGYTPLMTVGILPKRKVHKLATFSAFYDRSLSAAETEMGLYLYSLLALYALVEAKTQRYIPPPKCQPITVPQCKDLPYNVTRYGFCLDGHTCYCEMIIMLAEILNQPILPDFHNTFYQKRDFMSTMYEAKFKLIAVN